MLISAKDLIEKSLNLYRNNWELFLKYLLLLFIPTGLLAVVSLIFGSFNAVLLVYGLSLPIIAYLSLMIVASIFALWISLTFVRVLAARYEQKDTPGIRPALQTSAHLVIPAILVSLLTSLIILGGLALLIVPGIIFAVWLAFSFYAVALDELPVMKSFGFSKGLVKGRWWEVLWRLAAPAVVFGVILLLINWLVGLFFEAGLRNFEPDSAASIIILGVLTLLSTAISLLFTPLTSAAPTILYLELKKSPITEEKKIEPPQA